MKKKKKKDYPITRFRDRKRKNLVKSKTEENCMCTYVGIVEMQRCGAFGAISDTWNVKPGFHHHQYLLNHIPTSDRSDKKKKKKIRCPPILASASASATTRNSARYRPLLFYKVIAVVQKVFDAIHLPQPRPNWHIHIPLKIMEIEWSLMKLFLI